jgi:hypothetical protein
VVVGLARSEGAVDRQRLAGPEEGFEPPFGVGRARIVHPIRSPVPASGVRGGDQAMYFVQ